MDKLQQEITEYIKDSMDKTLREGVIMRSNGRNFILVKADIESAIEELSSELSDLKILGHYDITAVEICILSASNFDYIESETDCTLDYKVFYDRNGRGENIKLSRKPLHLYGEQENKDLLELFEKLGT